MKTITLDQRSSDWKLWRNTGIGSSDAAAIVGLSPWADARDVWKQKVATRRALRALDKLPEEKRREAMEALKIPSKRTNSAMARGTQLEPVVNEMYELLMGWPAPPACGVHDEHDWLKVSLDGYNAEHQIAVEIKCPNRDDHADALAGHIPEKYVAQCNHQLLVSGAKRTHYVSYSNYFPASKKFAVVDVPRNEEQIALLYAAEKEFWQSVLDEKEPT